MNETPDHLDPDHLDDGILSALLDGAAADAGAPGPEVAAHLGACDRCAGRRAELAAARAALIAAPIEPLDELTRRRLVARALPAADDARRAAEPGGARWLRRHPAFVGSAAAVVLAVLVGVPFVVGHGGSQAEKTLSAAAPNAAQDSAGQFYGDLGDLSDHDRLRLRLSGSPAAGNLPYAPAEPGPSPAAGSPVAGPAPAATPAAGGLASSPEAARSSSPSTTVGPHAGDSGFTNAPKSEAATSTDAFATTDQAASRDRADTDACVAALLDGPARDGRLTASGTGTFRGRPAVVAVFELSGGRVAFVADRSGCAVLDRFSL